MSRFVRRCASLDDAGEYSIHLIALRGDIVPTDSRKESPVLQVHRNMGSILTQARNGASCNLSELLPRIGVLPDDSLADFNLCIHVVVVDDFKDFFLRLKVMIKGALG